VTLEYIENSLKQESTEVMDYIAPASGLILHAVIYE
jgi:tRNA pseudouridine38-40 synthase